MSYFDREIDQETGKSYTPLKFDSDLAIKNLELEKFKIEQKIMALRNYSERKEEPQPPYGLAYVLKYRYDGEIPNESK